MSKEQVSLKVKEQFLVRYLGGEDDAAGAAALAFIFTLRNKSAEARKKGDAVLKKEFEDWQWDVEQDDVVAILEEHGWINSEDSETEEEAEEKKD